MPIELKMIFQDSKELAQFALWWDSRHDARLVDQPLTEPPTHLATKEEMEALTLPTPEPAKHPLVVTPDPSPDSEPEMTRKTIEPAAFQAAVKRWFADDPQARASVIKSMLDKLGVEKLADIPEDKFISILTHLGVA